MRILVTGGRDYKDVGRVNFVVDALLAVHGNFFAAHGCATGADTLWGDACEARGLRVSKFPADWKRDCDSECKPGHRKTRPDGSDYCPAAGPRRNQQMLDEFKPDLLVAFAGGFGTEHMCRIAKAAGVEILHGDSANAEVDA